MAVVNVALIMPTSVHECRQRRTRTTLGRSLHPHREELRQATAETLAFLEFFRRFAKKEG